MLKMTPFLRHRAIKLARLSPKKIFGPPTLDTIWQWAFCLCLIAALWSGWFQISQAIDEYHKRTTVITATLISTAKPTVRMAIEYLDTAIAKPAAESLTAYPSIEEVLIFDDFGNLLEHVHSPIKDTESLLNLAIIFGVQTKYLLNIPIELNNGRTGTLSLHINEGGILADVISKSAIFIFISVAIPFIYGFCLYRLGPYRIKRSFKKLHTWLAQTNEIGPTPAPPLEQLYFQEVITFGQKFFVTLNNLREQLTRNEIQQKRLSNQMLTDPLTGCRNRYFLEHFHNHADGSICAIVLWNVDDFKYINARFGHSIGDHVLQLIANSLQQKLELLNHYSLSHDIIRFSGDEFIVLLYGEAESTELAKTVEIICQNINQFFAKRVVPLMHGHFIKLTTAYIVERQQNQQPKILIDDIATAMALIKESSRGKIINLSSEERYSVPRRRVIRRDIGEALRTSSLRFQYQSIVNLKSGQLCGYEALIRWAHPTLGNISPIEFVRYLETGPLAYDGTIHTITDLFQDMSELRRRGYLSADNYMSFNLSSHQVVSTNIFELLQKKLEEFHFTPKNLQIEITEDIDILLVDSVLNQLHRCQDLGIGIALDDFGSGYASTHLLLDLPLSKLKLDRSLIDNHHCIDKRLSLLRHINNMCDELGIGTVCEGIENESQRQIALDSNCNEAQGYYFSRPKFIEDISVKLSSQAIA